jgi:hypothetical protein
MLLTEFAFDAPVVGKIQLPPSRIVQRSILPVSKIAKVKAPVLVKGDSFPRPRISDAN